MTVARSGLAGFVAVVVLVAALLIAREPDLLLHVGALAFVVAVSGILIAGAIWLSTRIDVEVRLAVDDIWGVRVSGRQVRLDLGEIRQIRRFCMAGRQAPVEVLRLLGPRVGQRVVASSTMDGYAHLRQRLLEHRRLAGLITGPTRWDAAVFKLRPCPEDPCTDGRAWHLLGTRTDLSSMTSVRAWEVVCQRSVRDRRRFAVRLFALAVVFLVIDSMAVATGGLTGALVYILALQFVVLVLSLGPLSRGEYWVRLGDGILKAKRYWGKVVKIDLADVTSVRRFSSRVLYGGWTQILRISDDKRTITITDELSNFSEIDRTIREAIDHSRVRTVATLSDKLRFSVRRDHRFRP